MAAHFRGLPDSEDDFEIVESESLRRDRGGSEIIGHRTRESFMRATGGRPQVRCHFCPGYADAPDHLNGCPRYERISSRDANRGLLEAFRLHDTGRSGSTRRDPILATDAEIRACTRRLPENEAVQ